jgi:hypothetical protein
MPRAMTETIAWVRYAALTPTTASAWGTAGAGGGRRGRARRVASPTAGLQQHGEGRVNSIRCIHARARGAARSDRPAPAAWAALRLPADVADSFFTKSGWGRPMATESVAEEISRQSSSFSLARRPAGNFSRMNPTDTACASRSSSASRNAFATSAARSAARTSPSQMA